MKPLLLVLHVAPTGRQHTVRRGRLEGTPALHIPQARADVIPSALGQVTDRTAGAHRTLEVGPLAQLAFAHNVAKVRSR